MEISGSLDDIYKQKELAEKATFSQRNVSEGGPNRALGNHIIIVFDLGQIYAA